MYLNTEIYIYECLYQRVYVYFETFYKKLCSNKYVNCYRDVHTWYALPPPPPPPPPPRPRPYPTGPPPHPDPSLEPPPTTTTTTTTTICMWNCVHVCSRMDVYTYAFKHIHGEGVNLDCMRTPANGWRHECLPKRLGLFAHACRN